MIASASKEESTRLWLTSLFREKFGTCATLFGVPGRVNLIGEHTDYNDGFVMPASIDLCTWVAAAANNRLRRIRAYSDLYDEKIVLSLDDLYGPPRGHWSDFIRGVASTVQQAGYGLSGADLVVHGDLPPGAGLSSSASLEVALALALTSISGIDLPRLELVRLCQRAEHEYVGTRCGLMDQFAVGFGTVGSALMLDCRSLEYRVLPIPQSLRLVICNSMVRHNHASGEYNLRRQDCETAVKLLQVHLPEVSALRDVAIEDLERHERIFTEQVYRRCRHVVTENNRVLKAWCALEANNAERFGQFMYESHASLRHDYGVSCEELDLLVHLASSCPRVYGARMTGGGFGGCTVNLVRADSVTEFQSRIVQAYRQTTGMTPAVYANGLVQATGA